MAFTNYNWTCISGSLNQGQQYVDGILSNAPNIFTYRSTDGVATITSANYFLSKYQDLKVGDIIQGSGIDGYFDLQVTVSTDQSVTVVPRFTSQSLSPNRAVITDNNGNLAVSDTTALELSYVHGVTSSIQAQLDALLTPVLPDGQIFVGNSSNLASPVALSGDATLADTGVLTLSTVNSNVGSFGSSTAIPTITANAKGLITAITTNPVIAPAGTLTGSTLASNVLVSSLTTVGTLMGGTWNATVISPTYGGTGVNNGSNTLTLGGVTTFSGAFPVTFNFTGSTNVTFPTSGTLATTTATTIQGTLHQVLVNGTSGSPQSGPFTLTTPQNIDTTSTPQFAALGLGTAAGANGLILASGTQALFGGSAFTTGINFQFTQSSTSSTMFLWDGSSTTFNASSQAFGLLTQQTISPASSKNQYDNINLNFRFDTSSAGIGTVNGFHTQTRVSGGNNITTWRNIYAQATASNSYTGVITDHYTAYFERPTFGTNKVTAYFESVVGINVKPINTFDVAGGTAIGTYAGVNTPPTNGLIVSGSTLIGTTTDDGANKFQVSGGILTNTIKITTGASNGYFLTSDASGNASWTNSTGVAVTSLTGTANQVLVNGTSGSATTGAITLTTPQSIGTGSSPTFNGLTLTNPLTLANGGTSANLAASNGGILYSTASAVAILGGTATASKMLLSGSSTTPSWSTSTIPSSAGSTANKFLISDGTNYVLSGSALSLAGNLTTSGAFASTFTMTNTTSVTFPTSGTLATTANTVASATGTANQVLVNSTSGSAQTGACTFTLPQSIATSSNVTFGQLTLNGDVRLSLLLTATKTATDGGSQYNIFNDPTFSPTIDTINCAADLTYAQFSPPTGVTITNAYGRLFQSGGQGGLGSVTNGYQIYVNAPGFGTNKTALYTDNMSIGYTAITPPSNGLVVVGQSIFGGTSGGNGYVTMIPTTSYLYGLVLSGSVKAVSGTDSAYGMIASCDLNGPASGSTEAFQIYCNSVVTGGAGTLSRHCGILITGGTLSSGSAPTNNYGLYATAPGFGTNKAAIYSDNISIGFTATTPPTNGALIKGDTAIGNGANATNATSPFLYITSSAGTPTGVPSGYTGLIPIHVDSTNSKFYAYIGGAWKGVTLT